MNVGREALNQYIYDLGYAKALKFLNLTEQEAEKILYNKVINRKDRSDTELQEVEDTEIDVDNASEIDMS